MSNHKPQPSPKPAQISMVIQDPDSPQPFPDSGWKEKGYEVVNLRKHRKVLLVAGQGQEISFDKGPCELEAEPDDIPFLADSRSPSPSPK